MFDSHLDFWSALPASWRRLLLTGAVCLLSALPAAPAMARQDGRHLPTHADLTRARLEATKTAAAEKGGAEGDAAVTSDRYDVTRYRLNLRLDPAALSLDGYVHLVYASGFAGLQTVVLDLTDQLEVLAVSHPAGSLAYTHQGDSLAVHLPAGLALGQVDSFTVHYAGQPPEPTFNRGLMYRTYTLGGHQGVSVANMSQPAYAKYWWPCKDKPGDKALCEVTITVPEGLTAVSNGKLVGSSSPEAGWTSFAWREDYPIASYLVSVAVADYVLQEDFCSTTAGSEIPLNNWVFPPDAEDALVDFEPLCAMVEMCEGHFGPYPFQGEKYGHAEFLWTGGMEHQTVTSIGYGSLPGDGSRAWLIVHELGHQWFGDSLTPATWADIWLNEGFATYIEALWTEHLEGHEAYLAKLVSWREPGSWAVQGPVYDPMPVFPGRVIYDKGAWILHMLRGRLGDGVFFPMVRDWAQGGQRPLATVTTEEFIAHASTWAGEDLGAFLWPYLTSTDIPRVALEFSLAEGTGGPRSLVRLQLRQLQGTLFDNVYPVAVTTAAGQTVHRVRLAGATAAVELQADGEVLDLQLDPARWVLWEPAAATGPAEGLIGAYPNPSSDGYVQLRYLLTEPASVRLRVYDARGREVAAADLGQVLPEAGFNETAWNQRDQAGRPVASGVYWVALEVDGRRSLRRITIAR